MGEHEIYEKIGLHIDTKITYTIRSTNRAFLILI
jgi:hypothetical protein